MIEAFGDVALYEPNGSYPVMVDFPQGRVTPPFWSEPMGMGAKLRLKVGVENEAHYFLQQFIRPGLNTKWAFPPILFRDVDTPGRAPLIPLVSHCVDDGSNFLPGHAICGFLSCSFSHSSMVPVNLPIGHEVEVWIVQESIHAL